MLPNDPLVRELKPAQIEWINYNLHIESEAMNGGNKGGFRVESASDVPAMVLGGKAEGRSAGNYLGDRG